MRITGRLLSLALLLALLAPTPAKAQNELLLLRIRQTPKEALDPLINELSFGHHPRVPYDISSLLQDPDTQARIKAAYLLGFLDKNPRVVGPLSTATEDPDWEVRREALFALRRHGGRAQVKVVAALLGDAQRPVRLEAVRTLGALGGPAAGKALRGALTKVGEDRELEVYLLEAIGDTGDRASAPALKAKLKSPSETIRLTALRGLALLGDPSARQQLLAGLAAPEPYQRQDAAALLGKVEAPWSKKALEKALAGEPDPRTRLSVAEALGAQGVDAGLIYVLKVLDTDADGLAVPAADAMGRLKVDQKTVDRLRQKMATEGGGAGMGAPAPPAARPADTVPGEELGRLIRSLRERPATHAERLAAFSDHFKGVPYQISPLGEGAGFDPDPLARYDAVDCLTYVEQVLALAASPVEDPLPVLLDLRYARGRPSFGERNHLMMAEWIPRNVEKGYLIDVTREVGGEHVVETEKTLDAALWASRRGVDLPLASEEVPTGLYRLPIIPIAVFPEVMARIPDATLLLVVRRDLPVRPYRVTHLGFVFQKGEVTYLRHAAKAGYHQVVDERLDTFVRRNANYKKWPVEGFNLLAPRENPARTANL
ncbi:MAG: DUF1460 domain-containing protein [Deltaproteobacteria bacterium]|nr:DUF1460 domain-containing protein [Deltaproteobacteria bacterium]